jgi:hypothetical protein
MTSSFIPTVDEKYPGDQNSFRQYIFWTQSKCNRTSLLVLAFIFPTTPDTEYFGGMVIIKWMRPGDDTYGPALNEGCSALHSRTPLPANWPIFILAIHGITYHNYKDDYTAIVRTSNRCATGIASRMPARAKAGG